VTSNDGIPHSSVRLDRHSRRLTHARHFSQSPTLPPWCASGRLALEGSTAFAPAGQAIGKAYMSGCPSASVSVSGIATFNGLNAVATSGSAGQSQATAKATTPEIATQIAISYCGLTCPRLARGGVPQLYGQPDVERHPAQR